MNADGGTSVIAVIPAHNEERGIVDTITSLRNQTVRVNRVVVISDNSTDSTVDLAREAGAEVYETTDNTFKKAGALNQVLDILIPDLRESNMVFAIDADTSLGPSFVNDSLNLMIRRPEVGAVGGVFVGREPNNILELAQSNEYVRYMRQIDRSGKTMVLSGTAAMIRVKALRQVKEHRGTYYDNTALTEDMEIGLVLKTLGWKLASPISCRATTDLMPTLKDLHNQRVRWYRGAFENLRSYGLTKVTLAYWGQQLMLGWSVLMMGLYLSLTSVALVLGGITFNPLWAAVGFIFWLERLVTAWKNGWKGRLLAVVIIPELCYDIFLQWAFIKALYLSLRKTNAVWHHA